MVERLVPLAARAVAEQLDQLPEDQRLTSPLLSTLGELRRRFPQVRPDHGVTSELGRSQLVAMQSWYDAETARAYRAVDEATRWLALREHCASARLPWLEAYACWRAAESLLARGHGGRGDGVRWLRRGYDLAGWLGADRVRAELAGLARLARVALPAPATPTTVEHPLLAHLTPREREITALLCTGRTYAEIAATLVISEKTVSSHVSTILRKTGTASRIELTRQLTRQPAP
jgi:DNA-binding CsgD family transcriptional regulator